MKIKLIYSIIFFIFIFLFLANCSSTKKQLNPNSNLAKKLRQVGPINNPNYFGNGGKTQSIIVEGRAQFLKSGEQDAFDSALQHAMRKAVEQILGTMIDSRTKVDNFQLISDKIYARSYGFVQKYELLRERNEDNTKWLKIKAWVVLGDVRSDAQALGILQDRANRPIILVLIDEKDFDGNNSDFAQKKIEEILLKKQFEFVDKRQLDKVLARQRKTINSLLENEDELFSTALDSGAQVIIRGSVRKKINDVSNNKLFKNKNLKSVTVSLNLNSFTAGDGRLMAAKSKSESGVGLSKDAAFQAVTTSLAENIAGELVDEFIKKWDDRINSGFEYSVILIGISFEEVIKIKNNIQRNIEGIKAIFDRGFTGNTQTLLVRYTGESSRLAQTLISPNKLPIKMKLKNYDNKTIILYK